ncbi:receptor-type tyrosine-protein phosphatase N2 [Aplochiton taeniatus]
MGCLFEDELCTAYEFCTNDRVFGRCQDLQGSQLYTYDVSPSAIQRLRILLQRLAHRGLTWQDDITQRVISREMSKLRKIPTRQPAATPVLPARLSDPADRKPRPGKDELSKSLQKYLKGLGFFTQSGDQLGSQGEGTDPQEDDQPDMMMDNTPKSRPGWRKTTIYSHHPGAGHPPVTKVFTQSGEGKPPPLAAALLGKDPGRSRVLSSQLEQNLAGVPNYQQGDAAKADLAWPRGKQRYLGYGQPVLSEQTESHTAAGYSPLRPNLDRLLFKAGFNRPAAKEPLSTMDERFIKNVVNQLGRHSVNINSLMGRDLDQLAEAITGALQVVDGEEAGVGTGVTQPKGDQEAKREPRPVMEQPSEPDQSTDTLTQHDVLQGQQMDDGDKEPGDKDPAFFNKLLDYLNAEALSDVPATKTPVEVNMRGPPPEPRQPQRTVGLENVQSRTLQGRLPVPHPWEEREVALPENRSSDKGAPQAEEMAAAKVDSEVEKRFQGIVAPAETEHLETPQKKNMRLKTEMVHVGVKEFSSRGKDRHFGYIITDSDSLPSDQGLDLMERLVQQLNLHVTDLTQLSVLGPALTFRVGANAQNVTTADVARLAVQQKKLLEKDTGLKILEAGVSDKGSLTQIPVVKETRVEVGQFLVLSILSMVFILAVVASSGAVFCLRQRSQLRMKEKLASLGTDTSTDATSTYQELCRQRMALRTSERMERPETVRHSRLNSVSSQFSDGPMASPSARSSTSSWCEEPVPSNMDISTGHMILSYMEDHLKNKNRLDREWEALCGYQAELSTCDVGKGAQNHKRNRSDAVVVYDHSRITLKAENNHGNSDYINASPIMDHDPRNPTYISSQGPLPSTVIDFWQMVWESGCVVIVMLTPLSENGVKQCHHYWPDEGSDIYHIYEVNLVSEHIWCEDFLVRSFYLKNLQTNETRTVTQFHFLSWMDCGVPDSARTLLDFRRKVNKCYRGRSCPIIVHCSDGAGRSGTYILIDMVLNKMTKGAKEIDIAATLEHLRDQRAGMVQTKEQFEFALTAVAEEVNAILKALPQ